MPGKSNLQSNVNQLLNEASGHDNKRRVKLVEELANYMNYTVSHINKRRRLTWSTPKSSWTTFDYFRLSVYFSQKLGRVVTIDDIINKPMQAA